MKKSLLNAFFGVPILVLKAALKGNLGRYSLFRGPLECLKAFILLFKGLFKLFKGAASGFKPVVFKVCRDLFKAYQRVPILISRCF